MNKGILAAAALAFAPFTFATFATVAEAGPIYVGVEGENIAVGGYDTVSYFQGDGVPVVGNATYTVEHDGAEWRFASAENAERVQGKSRRICAPVWRSLRMGHGSRFARTG